MCDPWLPLVAKAELSVAGSESEFINSSAGFFNPGTSSDFLHDRLQGLERLICQQHDNLQQLMRELLLQQTEVLDIAKQKGAASDELQIVPTTYVSSQKGLGHSMCAKATQLRLHAMDLQCPELVGDSVSPTPRSKSDYVDTDLSQNSLQRVEFLQAPETKPSKVVEDDLPQIGETFSNFYVNKFVNKFVKDDSEKEEVEHDHYHWLIENQMFQAVIRISILANAFQFGLQVDLSFGQWNTCWTVLDNVFTAIFAVEMILSIGCLGLKYFNNRWHLLDFFVAWSSMIDTWFLRIVFPGEAGCHMTLRLLQILRLLRILKVLRLRRELHVLIAGIVDSTSSLLWVAVLLFLTIYTFAILCVEVVGDSSLAGQYSENGFDNVSHFGTLLRAMMTLFNIAILDSWSNIIRPVSKVQSFMVPVFVLFLVVTSFALLNALIGIIVERTTAAMQGQEELEDQQKRQQKLDSVKELVHIVRQLDENHDAMITKEEMQDVMSDPAFNSIVEQFELPAGFSGIDVHMMLDENGSGKLSFGEFIDGMFQLIYSNEFQNQCLAKLSVAKIKRCVFELRQDTLAQMQLIHQQISAMQRSTEVGWKLSL